MPIYFLRHGESEANLKEVFAGQRDDTPLSKLGLRQAVQAGEEIKEMNLGINRIIVSKLKRTYQTAVEVAKAISFDVDQIETDKRLLEYDMGSISGTSIRTIASQELTSAEGAEDPAMFQDRVLSFFREYKDSPDTILVVTHAGVGRIIEAAKRGIEPKEFYSIPPYPNCHILKLDLEWLN